MLRRLVKASAAVLGAGAAVLLAAGCAPVKMGAAAIVGDQRITIATLDTKVASLSQAAEKYPNVVQLNQEQMTQATLTWLIRFQVSEELARRAGITVTQGQAQRALDQILATAKAQAPGVRNVTIAEIMAVNGIPPSLAGEVGRYQAIYYQFARNANGGTVPAQGSPQATTVNTQFARAECRAAKSLKILVNPQFGRMDYTKFQIVPVSATVSRSEGPVKAGSPSGLAPAC